MAAAMEEEREAEQAARQGQQVQSYHRLYIRMCFPGPMQAQLDNIRERNQKHNPQICLLFRQTVPSCVLSEAESDST